MKVNARIRQLHTECAEKFNRLAKEVREIIKPQVEANNWFFTERVKELPSFAMKLETGRVKDPLEMEDFYGCTIIVPSLGRIQEAEALVNDNFKLKERRPKRDEHTHKKPSAFEFDDLRLYAYRRELISGSHEDLNGLVFEIQIKTILQHAWGRATHDTIYKSNAVSWPKERIAYQIKAMLEHAEVSISEAELLAKSLSIAKNDTRTNNMAEIIRQIESFWPEAAWPDDRKRLAENILSLIEVVGIDPSQLIKFLEAEKARNRVIPLNLSPYAFTLQALAQSPELTFETNFNKPKNKVRILIHRDMDLPKWMWEAHDKIVRIDSGE